MNKANNAPIAKMDLQLYSDRLMINVRLAVDRADNVAPESVSALSQVDWLVRGMLESIRFHDNYTNQEQAKKAEISGVMQ